MGSRLLETSGSALWTVRGVVAWGAAVTGEIALWPGMRELQGEGADLAMKTYR
jgi:hypothetical protein